MNNSNISHNYRGGEDGPSSVIKKNRKVYCDYLRIFAIFAVITLHVAAHNWYSTDVTSFEWSIFNFFDSIVRWGVPVFVMISGSLFLGREIDTKQIYSKYVLRLVIAYVVWSIFYAFLHRYSFNDGLIKVIKTYVGHMAAGQYHMWFILMIIGLYIGIPIFHVISKDRNLARYFLILSFIFGIFLPWFLNLPADFIHSQNLHKVINAINSKINTMNVSVVLGFSFYFILGHYLDNTELKINQRKLIYLLGLAGFFLTFFLTEILSLKTHAPVGNYYGNMTLNVALEAICIHTLFKYHTFNRKWLNRFFANSSKYVFAIYLVHVFILQFISFFGITSNYFNPILSIPAISISTFIIAYFISLLLNKIPLVNKYCV